jgi:pyrroline-5-carboxylate reductase
VGSAKLLEESGQSAEALRRQVTSPGGTTEAALRVLEEANFADLLKEAIKKAWERSRELGREI